MHKSRRSPWGKLALRALIVFPMILGGGGRASAEFQIQEAGIEQGQAEFEYRGAYHWGVPEATENNENANDLVQSHEFELEHAFINWWLMQFTLGTEQPLHEDFNLSDVEIESEFGLIKRKGDGIALSFQVGQAINHGEAASPPKMEFSLNVGVQFGLTDATSDTAPKFQGSLSF